MCYPEVILQTVSWRWILCWNWQTCLQAVVLVWTCYITWALGGGHSLCMHCSGWELNYPWKVSVYRTDILFLFPNNQDIQHWNLVKRVDGELSIHILENFQYHIIFGTETENGVFGASCMNLDLGRCRRSKKRGLSKRHVPYLERVSALPWNTRCDNSVTEGDVLQREIREKHDIWQWY